MHRIISGFPDETPENSIRLIAEISNPLNKIENGLFHRLMVTINSAFYHKSATLSIMLNI